MYTCIPFLFDFRHHLPVTTASAPVQGRGIEQVTRCIEAARLLLAVQGFACVLRQTEQKNTLFEPVRCAG